jgi:hypothetical protein
MVPLFKSGDSIDRDPSCDSTQTLATQQTVQESESTQDEKKYRLTCQWQVLEPEVIRQMFLCLPNRDI